MTSVSWNKLYIQSIYCTFGFHIREVNSLTFDMHSLDGYRTVVERNETIYYYAKIKLCTLFIVYCSYCINVKHVILNASRKTVLFNK